MTAIWSVALIVVGCVAGAYAAILLKKGADHLTFNFFSIIKNKHIILGITIYALGTITYIIALRGGELSLLYPLVATTYIWTALLSQKLLGEKMNLCKWLGIALILIGVTFIGIGT